jgi:hypothetical protein
MQTTTIYKMEKAQTLCWGKKARGKIIYTVLLHLCEIYEYGSLMYCDRSQSSCYLWGRCYSLGRSMRKGLKVKFWFKLYSKWMNIYTYIYIHTYIYTYIYIYIYTHNTYIHIYILYVKLNWTVHLKFVYFTVYKLRFVSRTHCLQLQEPGPLLRS